MLRLQMKKNIYFKLFFYAWYMVNSHKQNWNNMIRTIFVPCIVCISGCPFRLLPERVIPIFVSYEHITKLICIAFICTSFHINTALIKKLLCSCKSFIVFKLFWIFQLKGITELYNNFLVFFWGNSQAQF